MQNRHYAILFHAIGQKGFFPDKNKWSCDKNPGVQPRIQITVLARIGFN